MENPDINERKVEDIFKSTKSVQICEELKNFETDLFKLLENVKFTTCRSKFQETLKKDLKHLLTKNKIILFSDRTINLYKNSLNFTKTS